jgi:Na+-driven multidrug efflux pump
MTEITAITPDQKQTERRDAITEGVAVLTGDPKRAIFKISGPLMVAMLFQAAYNLADAVWVAGLDSNALAAVGFIAPIFMIFIGLGSGLGVGVTSAASRRIGANDKAGADNAAMHGIAIALILSAVLTPALLLFIDPLVLALGAGETAAYAVEYGSIIFAGTVFILLADILSAVFTAEGNTRRTMYAAAASTAPQYRPRSPPHLRCGHGITGAAWATLISRRAPFSLSFCTGSLSGRTLISHRWRRFSPQRHAAMDILAVGILQAWSSC